jgi:hypothetical protein
MGHELLCGRALHVSLTFSLKEGNTYYQDVLEPAANSEILLWVPAVSAYGQF